jgi:hypothetical protein
MGTHTTTIVLLANTHQVVSLKLMNTNYLYWRMQMKLYLLGQGVFHFVDSSVPCPPSHIFDSSVGSSSIISNCVGNCPLALQHMLISCSSSKLTILRASSAKFTGTCHTFHSPESSKHTLAHIKWSLQSDDQSHHIWRVLTLVSRKTFPFERINHVMSGMIFQGLTSRLTTPPQTEISIFKCDNYYLSISIWSWAYHSSKSLLIPELRLPSIPP